MEAVEEVDDFANPDEQVDDFLRYNEQEDEDMHYEEDYIPATEPDLHSIREQRIGTLDRFFAEIFDDELFETLSNAALRTRIERLRSIRNSRCKLSTV